jgi:hypothetical protein
LEADAVDDKISSKLNPELGRATAGTSRICSKGAERVHGQNGDTLLIALSDLSVQGWVMFLIGILCRRNFPAFTFLCASFKLMTL